MEDPILPSTKRHTVYHVADIIGTIIGWVLSIAVIMVFFAFWGYRIYYIHEGLKTMKCPHHETIAVNYLAIPFIQVPLYCVK